MFPLSTNAHQPAPTREHPAFANKDFAGYLAEIAHEFTERAPAKLSFETVTRIAVALDKTGTWAEQPGLDLYAALAKYPEGRFWLDAVRLLMREDPSGMLALIAGRIPDPQPLMQSVDVLRAHDYSFAANALGALAPDLPGKRIVALLSIPKEKRDFVERTLLRQVTDPPNRLMLARTALDMFTRPPEGFAIEADEYFALALTLGQGTHIVSFETAQQLAQSGKTRHAVGMVSQLARASADDLIVQRRAAEFMRSLGDDAATISFYRQALEAVPEPQRREMRMDYLAYLQWLKRHDDLAALRTGEDRLLAGDALLLTANLEAAATRYAALLADRQAPIAARLAAWTGLLDADPAHALRAGVELVDEFAQAEPAVREPLVAWAGRQLWAGVSREIPPQRGAFVVGSRQAYRPLREAEGWEARAAALAAGLLEADTLACLKIDSRVNPPSFRYPAAMIFALAGEAEAALEILARKIEYEIPPPPEGWRIFDGTTRPDAFQPRTRVTPTPAETQRFTRQLLDDLVRCPQAHERVPPLGAAIAADLAKHIAAVPPEREMLAQLTALGAVLKTTVEALDPLPRNLRTDQPPPPPHDVDLAKFTPLDTAVRGILTNDAVAKYGLQLINEGLRDALLTASNPELLVQLTELSIVIIERYAQASQRPQYAVDARKRLASYLAARKVYDMTPYITRLNTPATLPAPGVQ